MVKFFKIIKNLFWAAIGAFLILIGITFLPIKGNYKVFTVQSGSMEPAIHTGSLIFVKNQKEYNVGDIVTRATNDVKVTVTHRIFSKKMEGGQAVFETKGDANEDVDGEVITQDKIIGKKFFQLPYIGYPIGYARTMPGFILLVIVPAVIIVYEEILKIKDEIVRISKDKKKKKEPEEIKNIEFEHAQPQYEEGEKKRRVV